MISVTPSSVNDTEAMDYGYGWCFTCLLAGIILFFYLLYSVILAALNNSQLNQTLRELLRHIRDSDHARKAEMQNPGADGVSAPSETCPACGTPVSPVYHWCPSCGLKLQVEP